MIEKKPPYCLQQSTVAAIPTRGAGGATDKTRNKLLVVGDFLCKFFNSFLAGVQSMALAHHGDFQWTVQNRQWRTKDISSHTAEISLKSALVCRVALPSNRCWLYQPYCRDGTRNKLLGDKNCQCADGKQNFTLPHFSDWLQMHLHSLNT